MLLKQIILLSALTFGAISADAIVSPAHADSPEIYTSWRDNVAVGGYDVVSFYNGKATEGDRDHVIAYKGVIWQFATESNMERFRKDPEAFIPQYGGYCAWAIAKGKLAKGSPEYWYLEDGKLYLNFNKRIARRWAKKKPQFIERADANWPKILE